jgi:hypothetical protein
MNSVAYIGAVKGDSAALGMQILPFKLVGWAATLFIFIIVKSF